MSYEQLLLAMLIFVVIIFFIDFYFVKVLKINRPKKTPFDKERKKLFVVSEVIILIGL